MKNSIENIQTRQASILLLLQKKGELTAKDLAEELKVSLSTIRRDLIILENKNDIIRKHGYCLFNFKNKEHFDETGPLVIKNLIGKEAAKFINNYDSVFINTSSTALSTLDYVTADYLTIISNNLKLKHKQHIQHSTYLLTGGEMRFPKEALVGDIAINTITGMNADVCIIGCNGVDLENGVTTKILHEAKINEVMINQTRSKRILVADHRKIGQTSKFKIADLSVFDYLITDQYSSAPTLKAIEKLGLQVIQVFV